jgi:hypothetical protein
MIFWKRPVQFFTIRVNPISSIYCCVMVNWNHRKKSSAKAPEPIYRLYFERGLEKAQGSWSFIFLHQEVERIFFASDIFNSRIYIFCSRKHSEKSKVQHIMWYKLTIVVANFIYFGIDAQGFGLRLSFLRWDLCFINQK